MLQTVGINFFYIYTHLTIVMSPLYVNTKPILSRLQHTSFAPTCWHKVSNMYLSAPILILRAKSQITKTTSTLSKQMPKQQAYIQACKPLNQAYGIAQCSPDNQCTMNKKIIYALQQHTFKKVKKQKESPRKEQKHHRIAIKDSFLRFSHDARYFFFFFFFYH
eukprot:TRINITY_DN9239_c0_g1_i1.p3 TRINITY_DN9239_c0_g1~~TRINITY_DN9239_c0_g1_i1.p3  ORF type:complete len:177 (+),score=0.28 TRINITY_DN9239_c0_g1_i1:45-533(+)